MRPLALVWFALVFALSAALGVHSVLGDAQPGRASRSPIVYPQSAGALRMDHALPAHRALPCTQCHVQPAAVGGERWPELAAREASCAPCHADRLDRAETTAARCGYCHVGFDPARSSAVPGPRARADERPRLVFDHGRHRDQPCASCHASASGGGEPDLPEMQTCLSCHQGARSLACAACHPADASGRLHTRFAEGRLKPRSGFLGIAHDRDFVVRHRWLAADHGGACRSCHTEDECVECHDGRRRPRSIHPNDYLSLHAQEAMRAADRCTSCHATQSFCQACHARLGIAQRAAPDLASPRRYHPPPAQWSRGPVLHAREAERSLQSCITCHAERDCVDCHGSQASGFVGISPHPAGFVQDCARLLARDPRPCMTCHQARDASLMQRCR
jgi:Cytochrome c7 and related cytochrome c